MKAKLTQRKLSYLALALVVFGFAATAKYPNLANIYNMFAISVLSIAGVHHLSEFGNNYLNTPNQPIVAPAPIPPMAATAPVETQPLFK